MRNETDLFWNFILMSSSIMTWWLYLMLVQGHKHCARTIVRSMLHRWLFRHVPFRYHMGNVSAQSTLRSFQVPMRLLIITDDGFSLKARRQYHKNAVFQFQFTILHFSRWILWESSIEEMHDLIMLFRLYSQELLIIWHPFDRQNL